MAKPKVTRRNINAPEVQGERAVTVTAAFHAVLDLFEDAGLGGDGASRLQVCALLIDYTCQNTGRPHAEALAHLATLAGKTRVVARVRPAGEPPKGVH